MTVSVGIIGAGFGGLAAAIELERSGITDFVVLERGASVGGVWRDNTYPGAQCDVPSVIYSFSYELQPKWSQRFGTQPEIHDYLKRCAVKYGVQDKIRFNTEVVAATWDEPTATWRVEVASGEVLRFNALIAAPGQLSNPKIPDLPGLTDFAGTQFHSAQWRHDVDLTGKKVAVVGSGASAVQVVPAIVERVEKLTLVQRSPNWVVDKHNHRNRGILARIPGLTRLFHNVEWLWFEARVPMIFNWFDPLRPITFEGWTKLRLRLQVRDSAKRAAITPDYKIGCNRALLSKDWFPAIDRDNVDVVGSAVEKVLPNGLITADGTTVEADVIVWCTGFDTTHYLAPIDITGRDGRKLHDEWRGGPEAYLGVSVNGYPNLFMVYGPNTGSLTNTIIWLLEKQAAYARQGIQQLSGGRAFDVLSEVQSEFNAKLRTRLSKTVFTSGCPGWYSTDDGKIIAVWPGSHVAYGRAVAKFDQSRYEDIQR